MLLDTIEERGEIARKRGEARRTNGPKPAAPFQIVAACHHHQKRMAEAGWQRFLSERPSNGDLSRDDRGPSFSRRETARRRCDAIKQAPHTRTWEISQPTKYPEVSRRCRSKATNPARQARDGPQLLIDRPLLQDPIQQAPSLLQASQP